MVSLLSVVQPDDRQRQQGQALLDNFQRHPKYMHLKIISPQKLHIDKVQDKHLGQIIPPSSLMKRIEGQDRQHAEAVIVHKGDHPRDPSQKHDQKDPYGLYRYIPAACPYFIDAKHHRIAIRKVHNTF